jgi:acetoin utilization deacetylase AcuC-like enzyme
VAARTLLRDGTVKRPAVIDLDAHQGNGTAFIFSDGEVRTFSAHRVEGYPRNRVRSSMDVDIPLGASDEVYLAAVKRGVLDFLGMARPDFVFALCSADAYKEDALGGLKVTMEGLRARDEFLFRELAERRIPVCLTMGGAYSTPEEAAEINFATIKAAAAAYPSFGGKIII